MSKRIHEYYRILGLEDGASLPEITQAYKDLSRVFNPIRFQHDTRLAKGLKEKVLQVSLAYQHLHRFHGLRMRSNCPPHHLPEVQDNVKLRQMSLIPEPARPEQGTLGFTGMIKPNQDTDIQPVKMSELFHDELFTNRIFGAADFDIQGRKWNRYPRWFYTPDLEEEDRQIHSKLAEYEYSELDDEERKEMGELIYYYRENTRLIRESKPILPIEEKNTLEKIHDRIRDYLAHWIGDLLEVRKNAKTLQSRVRYASCCFYNPGSVLARQWIVHCGGTINEEGYCSWVDIHAALFIAKSLLHMPETWWDKKYKPLRESWEMRAGWDLTSLGAYQEVKH